MQSFAISEEVLFRRNRSFHLLRGERGRIHLLLCARTQTVLLAERPPQSHQCTVGRLLVRGGLLQLRSAPLLLFLLREKDQIFGGGLPTDRAFAGRLLHRFGSGSAGFGTDSLPFPRAAVADHRSTGGHGADLGGGSGVVSAEAALRAQRPRLHSDCGGFAAGDSVGDPLPLRAEWQQSDQRHSLFRSLLLHPSLGPVNCFISVPFPKKLVLLL